MWIAWVLLGLAAYIGSLCFVGWLLSRQRDYCKWEASETAGMVFNCHASNPPTKIHVGPEITNVAELHDFFRELDKMKHEGRICQCCWEHARILARAGATPIGSLIASETFGRVFELTHPPHEAE